MIQSMQSARAPSSGPRRALRAPDGSSERSAGRRAQQEAR